MFHNQPARRKNVVFALIALSLLLLSACSAPPSGSFASIPAGKGYAAGAEIYFAHTETSDPAIAEKLTNMMKSPVIHVPSLAQVPAEALAEVYVFENGVSGSGPLGFQPDVFNKPPQTQGYSPLRQIILVKWAEGAKAAELKSEDEILQAETDGQLTTTPSGVVVNMPFMVWQGGKR